MADGFEIKMDELRVKVSLVKFKSLIPTIKEALNGIIARHSQYYTNAQGPDGTAQPALSDKYAEAKKDGKIKGPEGTVVGGEPIRNFTLTGTLLKSIQVNARGGDVTAEFTGSHSGGMSNAQLAGYQESLGGKIHYFSKKDEELVIDMVTEKIDKLLEDAVRVRRRT